MQKIAEQGFLKETRKYFISSYFEEEILIDTRMAKFYLELGLKITRIQKFIQFFPCSVLTNYPRKSYRFQHQ